jgi:hypothetical protein
MGIASVLEVSPLPLVVGLGNVAGGVVTPLLGVLQVEGGSFLEKWPPLAPSPERDRGLLRRVPPPLFSEEHDISKGAMITSSYSRSLSDSKSCIGSCSGWLFCLARAKFSVVLLWLGARASVCEGSVCEDHWGTCCGIV